MEWKDGYVIDSVYKYSFWPTWSPAHMAFIALLNNIQPPPLDRFRYVDLGCGHGTQLVLLAAANPQGTFVGVDFNPEHIETGEKLKRELGLENLSFICASFDDLVQAPPEGFCDFDYILAHGVYSFISDSARVDLVRLLRQVATRGAVATISYNAMPGCCAPAALQRYILELSAHLRGTSDVVAFAGLLAARGLRDLGAKGFFDLPTINLRLDSIDPSEKGYLAHEYLNKQWRAFYFSDVHDVMLKSSINYVGTHAPEEAFPDLTHSSKFFNFIPNLNDKLILETTSDFYLNRQFRSDVYRFGTATLDDAERAKQLKAMNFCVVNSPEEWSEPVQSRNGKEVIGAAAVNALKQLLAAGPSSGGEIAATIAKHQPDLDPARALAVLAHRRDVRPVLPVKTDPDASRRFNRLVCAERPYGSRFKHLASPVCGTGVELDHRMSLALGTAHEGPLERRIAAATAFLAECGEPLTHNGQPITDVVTQKLLLASGFMHFQERMQKRYDLLGISL